MGRASHASLAGRCKTGRRIALSPLSARRAQDGRDPAGGGANVFGRWIS